VTATTSELTTTATADELTAPRRGLVSALQHSLPRNEFFAGLYILACVNGLLGRSIYTFNLEGWRGAVMGFEINVIVLAACFAGVYLIASNSRGRIRTLDLVVALAFLGLVTLPIYALSWVAVTGLSLYILLFANDGSERRRGALILLALAVPMLWSRLLFQFFARPLLELDATLAAWLLGTERIGNLVRFADDSGNMVITPACASFGNMTYAFLCWVVISHWVNHRWRSIDLVWLFLACASVVAINVTRIALTGQSQANFQLIHNQYGEVVEGTIFLCLIVGFSVIGARRELFPRA
jgi:exosortase/archaeosortase family protein